MKIMLHRLAWVFTIWAASIGAVDISDVPCGEEAPWVTSVSTTRQSECEATCEATCGGYRGYLKNGRLSDPICFDKRLNAAGDFQPITFGSRITFSQCRCYAPFNGLIEKVPDNSELLCTSPEFTFLDIHDKFSCESKCGKTTVLGLKSSEGVRLLHCGDVPVEQVKHLIPHCSVVKEKVTPNDGPEKEISSYKCTCSVPVALVLFTDKIGSLRANIQNLPSTSELPQPGSLNTLKKDKGKEPRHQNHHRNSTTRSHGDTKSEKHRDTNKRNSSSDHTMEDIKPIIPKNLPIIQKQSKRENKIPSNVILVEDDDEPIGSPRRDKKPKKHQSQPSASNVTPPPPHEVLNIDSDDSTSTAGKKHKSKSRAPAVPTPFLKVVKEEVIESPSSLPPTPPRDKRVAQNRERHSSSPSANNSHSKMSNSKKHSPETSGLTVSGPATSSAMPDLSKLRRGSKKNAASSANRK